MLEYYITPLLNCQHFFDLFYAVFSTCPGVLYTHVFCRGFRVLFIVYCLLFIGYCLLVIAFSFLLFYCPFITFLLALLFFYLSRLRRIGTPRTAFPTEKMLFFNKFGMTCKRREQAPALPYSGRPHRVSPTVLPMVSAVSPERCRQRSLQKNRFFKRFDITNRRREQAPAVPYNGRPHRVVPTVLTMISAVFTEKLWIYSWASSRGRQIAARRAED